MTASDDILAIPLWINGHAFLTMAQAFYDVRDAQSGQVRRRTPLCGAPEALSAVDSARAALAPWSALGRSGRARRLAAVGSALESYAEHFAGLIGEETGKDAAAALAEVADAVRLLREPVEAGGLGGVAATSDEDGGVVAVISDEVGGVVAVISDEVGGVVAVISDDGAPLLGALQRAVPELLAGATVVVKPSPRAPSALFALAELTAQSAFPGGVFNILQGDLAAIEGLCAIDAVRRVAFAGAAGLGERVGAIALRHGKTFAG